MRISKYGIWLTPDLCLLWFWHWQHGRVMDLVFDTVFKSLKERRRVYDEYAKSFWGQIDK